MLGASQPTSVPSNHVTYRQGPIQDGAVTPTLCGEEASSEKCRNLAEEGRAVQAQLLGCLLGCLAVVRYWLGES